MNAQPDWDDLRVFLAVARHGSLAAAARALGINHSTVFRRVGTLEAAIGARLFDRLPGGYALTAAGEEMQASAGRVEEEIAAATGRLSGGDAEPSGTLRVTTSDLMASYFLPRHLVPFRAAYPRIRIDLTVASSQLSLTKREADVAIRGTMTAGPPEALVGRAVAESANAVYAARDYVERNGPIVDLAAHDWVTVDESYGHLPFGRWLAQRVPPERVAYRANGAAPLVEAAKAGVGLALLPCGIGDAAAELRRVGEPIPEFTSRLWLLTHSDLRHSGRVRAFLDFMAAAIAEDRDLLEGRRPQPD